MPFQIKVGKEIWVFGDKTILKFPIPKTKKQRKQMGMRKWVIILGRIRKGEIGVLGRKEQTAIGELYRIDFPNGESGLYRKSAFKELSHNPT